MTHHDQRRHNPVGNDAESNLYPYLSLAKGKVKGFVADFTQYRVHHNEQSDSCGQILAGESSRRKRLCCSPIGTDTPTNFPFCKASPIFGTKFPKIIPMTIANKIQRASSRSSRPKLLNADVFVTAARAPSLPSPTLLRTCCSTSRLTD